MTKVPDVTPKKQRAAAWKPGQSGNPAGRPIGARSKLGEIFLQDLQTVWTKHGISALEAAAIEKPAEFVRVIASLLPRQLDVSAAVVIDAPEFLDRFRRARELVGNGAKVIEHGGG